MAGSKRARPGSYSTVLPSTTVWNRRLAALVVSVVFHVCLVWWLLAGPMRGRVASLPQQREAVQPIQLTFAPPRPTPTPRPVQPVDEPRQEVPAVPLTPGPDPDPGSTARVTPTPEEDPNAPPNTTRTEATRPDPSPDEGDRSTPPTRGDAAAAEPTPGPVAPVPATSGATALETEARRLFGRGLSRLGALAGRADNRPWETANPLDSRGCSLPPPDPSDSTLPAGMAAVAGRIYREDNGQPLAGARLQILGTAFGTFSNDVGEYKLVFDRSLVDRCRTQSVRVSAPGYAGRDVILFIGEPLSSDVPLRRY